MDKIDYRYITKNESRDFHRRRRAFVIYKNKLHFIDEGSAMSHWEFCSRILNMGREEFNLLTRGYYIDGNLVFYKDNFIYDEGVIEEALNFIPEIKDVLKIQEMKIYFGLIIGKPGEDWQYDFYYGDYINDSLVKYKVK